MPQEFDVVCLGGGVAGEALAAGLQDSGLTLAVVERELVGGECPYWGCVPSKTLLRSGETITEADRARVLAASRVEWTVDFPKVSTRVLWMARNLDDSKPAAAMEATGAKLIRGEGTLTDPRTVVVGGEQLVARRAVVIANGSTAAIPAIPGLDTIDFDLKLEVVIIPVSDVDRAKRFYGGLGWRLDADFAFDSGVRVVQFTPPGSGCSIQFGTNITSAAPGSAQDLYLVVSDIEAAREDLIAKGATMSEVFHPTAPGAQFTPAAASGRASGPAPEHASYRSFATFSDPDGNGWLLQEIKTRLPGRGLSFDVATLTEVLRDAELRHGEYEPTAPKHHWSDWYAGYIVARERGKTSDEAVKDATRRMNTLRSLAQTSTRPERDRRGRNRYQGLIDELR